MTTPPEDPKLLHCPALTAVRVIAGKWKTRVLWRLRAGPSHFGGLHAALPGVSAKVLAEQLRQMEGDGLIARAEAMRGGVAHVFYDFTAYGRTLIPVLNALGDWGLAHEAAWPQREADPGRGQRLRTSPTIS